MTSSALDRPPLRVLLVIGVLGGLLSGTFGAGGGIILVPLLVTFAGFDQRRAAATSLLAILPSSLSAAITYLLHDEVDLLAAAIIAAGAVGGSLLGARLLRRLPLRALSWGFIVLLVVVAIRMALLEPVRGEPLALSPWVVIAYVALGIVMGITSGLFGVGGALVSVPVLVAILGVSDLIAKGTSLGAIAVTSATGSIANRRTGLVDVRSGLIVGLAAAAAAVPAVYLALALPPRLSSLLFAALLLVIAVQLTVRAVRERG